MNLYLLSFLLLGALVIGVTCDEAEEECEPGEIRKVDCNTCKCINGKLACTKKRCIIRPTRDAPCSPGDSKTLGCNKCNCFKNGRWSCTVKNCNRKKRDAQPGEKCEPGKSYKKGCNTCVCNKDGTNAACTLKACFN